MGLSILASWILAAMVAAQPVAPWRETYPSTAETFAQVATDTPLFSGAEGPRKTASWFVSVAWFEGRFDPQAKGDCSRKDKAGRCLSPPQSLCMMQIGVSNLERLGISAEEILGSVEVCTRAAVRMMKISLGVCRERPLEERLGQYAAGGGTCDNGIRESKHRIAKAKFIFDHVPLPKSE